MFTWRYHVASLAAVFLALAVGVLLGVAVSGKVSDVTESLNEAERDQLSRDLREANESLDLADRRRETAEALLERAYPALMDRRLEDRRVTVVFLGPVQGDIRATIERTLADAGSGRAGQLIAIDTPIDPQELEDALQGDERLAAYADQGDDFAALGEALGRELLEADETTTLWGLLTAQLVEERAGTNTLAVEGAVVIRSWRPASGEADEATRATETLLDGLVDGLKSSGFPVVGVESLSALGEESQIEAYRQQGLSSVDNIDTLSGRVALAVLLAGGQPGHYGLKDSATDGVAPPIEPVPEGASGG
jgi:hypothetical protein